MDLQQYLADISLKTMSQLHRAIVHLTGGQVLGSAFGMPVVELHTVGRKSGQPRSTMLTAPVTEGDRVVLVASKGGDDRDPDWYRNLIAHPDIELTMAGRRRPMRARRASPPRRRSCGPGWWPPTPVTAVTSAAPNATSRWSSASRAERPPRLAAATAVRRSGRPALCLAGPLSGESAARQGDHTEASRFRPIRRRPRNPWRWRRSRELDPRTSGSAANGSSR